MSMWTGGEREKHGMHSVGKRSRTRATHSPLKWIPWTAATDVEKRAEIERACVRAFGTRATERAFASRAESLCAPYKTGHRMELKETADGRYRHDDTNDNEPTWLRYATHWRWHLVTYYASRCVQERHNAFLKFPATIMIFVKINAAFIALRNFHNHNFWIALYDAT